MLTFDLFVESEEDIKPLLTKDKLTKAEEAKLAETSNMPIRIDMSEIKSRITLHAKARARQRAHDMSMEDWRDLAKKIRTAVRANNITSGKYMFYSKSWRRGVVINFENKGKMWEWVTVMPIGLDRMSQKQKNEGQIFQLTESMVDVILSEEELVLIENTQVIEIEYDNFI